MGTKKYALYSSNCLIALGASFYVSAVTAGASDFGTNGLIRMPDARMAEDATLRVTVANDELADIYNITFQALPRLQATFRYTIFNPDEISGSRDGLRDRSYELKSQLWSESHWVPQISVGTRDILGTGAWEGEYVVASKAWGDLDLTLGMGWGRLGAVPVDLKTGALAGDDSNAWYHRMVMQSERAGLTMRSARLDPDSSKAIIEVTNRSYNLTADALNQAMLLSERYMPNQVARVDFLLEEDGWVGPTISYTLQRHSQHDEEINNRGVLAAEKIKILAPRKISRPIHTTNFQYPALGFGFDLAAKTQLMDPDAPFRSQLYAKLSGRLQLTGQFNIWARYEQDIHNDFSTDRQPDSPHLPNVRTLVNRYLVEGESGLELLYAE